MTSSIPQTMKAITISGNRARVGQNAPVPKPRPTYLLVKVETIALNPTDWKHIHRKMAADNGISGCDFAGTVASTDESVTKDLKVGDRVAGCAHGANFSQPSDGVFAEYAQVKGDLLVKIPDSLTFEQAATFPLGVSTVGQGLFQQALKLNLPTNPVKDKEWLLIYGGSSATGSLGIQYGRLAGYNVITTCSPHNNSFVASLGVSESQIFNYREPDCGRKINQLTNNKLRYAWDTISLESSAKICAEAISDDASVSPKRYGTILAVKPPRDDLEVTNTFMYTIFNEAFTKGPREVPASKDDFEFAKTFFALTETLLKDGKLKTHPEDVRGGGLEGALQGMKDMQEDKVSGKKLVYRVLETPDAPRTEMEY